jgi:hypothetical protein
VELKGILWNEIEKVIKLRVFFLGGGVNCQTSDKITDVSALLRSSGLKKLTEVGAPRDVTVPISSGETIRGVGV